MGVSARPKIVLRGQCHVLDSFKGTGHVPAERPRMLVAKEEACSTPFDPEPDKPVFVILAKLEEGLLSVCSSQKRSAKSHTVFATLTRR